MDDSLPGAPSAGDGSAPAFAVWTDALAAAALFAVDPVGAAGIVVRERSGTVRDIWLEALLRLWPAPASFRRLPLAIADDRLLGGLDLAATLAAGKPIPQRGLLADANGGVLLIPSAERLTNLTAARLTAVLDTGVVTLERDGLTRRDPARFGVVAFDEGADDDEAVAPPLADRLAFRIDLGCLSARGLDATVPFEPGEIFAARQRLPTVSATTAEIEALCGAAMALGIASPRAPILALKVARAAAALAGRSELAAEDIAIAGRLVLGPRATCLPPSPADAPDQSPADAQGDPPEPGSDPDQQPDTEAEQHPVDVDQALQDIVLAAAKAALPVEVLARLAAGTSMVRTGSSGRSETTTRSLRRGRPVGARPGEPRNGARLDIIATLRCAAPWQTIRKRNGAPGSMRRIEVRRSDLHVTHFEQRTERTTIFVVDASGSSALNRLAEAKGAVELVLADCYVRRDQVALIAFRRTTAELLLPPTRSLVRAKRGLAALPGGGGTPLALGIDAATELAIALKRRGQTPIVVLLTDGRANIARDGKPGRDQAETDAIKAAHSLRSANIGVLLVDTSPRAEPAAKRVADAMGATYIALPYAGATLISSVVKAALD